MEPQFGHPSNIERLSIVLWHFEQVALFIFGACTDIRVTGVPLVMATS